MRVDDNGVMPDASLTPSDPGPPRIVHGLGALALVPFVGGALLMWTADAGWHATVGLAMTAYAAVVVSFIGALHWGLAMRRPADAGGSTTALFVWGVVPSIVAWIAVLLPPRIGLSMHAAMLVACYVVDRATYPREHVGAWLPFRMRLTVVATLCCLLGALGA